MRFSAVRDVGEVLMVTQGADVLTLYVRNAGIYKFDFAPAKLNLNLLVHLSHMSNCIVLNLHDIAR